jgi:hypothetical protein
VIRLVKKCNNTRIYYTFGLNLVEFFLRLGGWNLFVSAVQIVRYLEEIKFRHCNKTCHKILERTETKDPEVYHQAVDDDCSRNQIDYFK